jgi:hypothetical protein
VRASKGEPSFDSILFLLETAKFGRLPAIRFTQPKLPVPAKAARNNNLWRLFLAWLFTLDSRRFTVASLLKRKESLPFNKRLAAAQRGAFRFFRCQATECWPVPFCCLFMSTFLFNTLGPPIKNNMQRAAFIF